MATIALMVGGALVNALAFSGSNYLFSKLGNGDAERVRHDKAIEQLQKARDKWSKSRIKKIDWINTELRREGLANQNFTDVDEAIREYHRMTGRFINIDEVEPKLSDFYTPSTSKKKYEIAFIIVGMTATGLIAYKLVK